MLTDPKLRGQVDALWDKFWTGGLTNPLDAIEQFSYLLFLKRLDDCENDAERQAKRKGTTDQPSIKAEELCMKTVHDGFTNARMDDSRFEYSWLHSWMVVWTVRVESLRGRMSEGERQVEGLFESLLAEAFNE